MNENIIIPLKGSGQKNHNEKYLEPETLTVKKGEKITFSNTDIASHTITSGTPDDGPDGKFDSALLTSGNAFDFVLEESGEYPYFDMVHPWIVGRIVVE